MAQAHPSTNPAPKIEVGRRAHFAGCGFGDDSDGVIVAVYGVPGENPDQVIGAMRVIAAGACTFDLVTFDGRFWNCRESSIGRPGIGGIRLHDRVHGPAMIERAHRLVAERKAADALAKIVAEENFQRQQAERVVVDPPVFYWNGIKDAKGEKLQSAYYSSNDGAGDITIYARNYRHFSEKVRANFQVRNDSDLMTDYFCQDSIRVVPAHPLYPQVLAACNAAKAHDAKRAAKRNGGAK